MCGRSIKMASTKINTFCNNYLDRLSNKCHHRVALWTPVQYTVTSYQIQEVLQRENRFFRHVLSTIKNTSLFRQFYKSRKIFKIKLYKKKLYVYKFHT